MLPVIAHSIIPVQFNSVHFTSINNNLYHLPAVTHRAIYIYIYMHYLTSPIAKGKADRSCPPCGQDMGSILTAAMLQKPTSPEHAWL